MIPGQVLPAEGWEASQLRFFWKLCPVAPTSLALKLYSCQRREHVLAFSSVGESTR